MKVLIACEESQAVTKAFRVLGHEAYSCDIKDCTGGKPDWHIKGDVLEVITQDWDLLIGHPPCTYLSYTGTRHWNAPGRLRKRLDALDFFAKLWEAPIKHICLENPKGCASPTIAKYNQEIQPYDFGDPHMKTTWLWLKNLPLLQYQLPGMFDLGLPVSVSKPEPLYHLSNGKAIHFTDAQGGKDRATLRSKTFPGIANAMATQFSAYLNNTK